MNTLLSLATIAMIVVGTASVLHAEESNTPTPSHEEHRQDSAGSTPSASQGMMGEKGSMMDHMDKDQMMGMMHDCMEKHKDGKMCDHHVMKSCQKSMKKGECMKMMKECKQKNMDSK